MTLASFDFTDRVRPIVELGVGDTRTQVGLAVWDDARWDTAPDATWAGTEPTWHDITCDVFSYRCMAGRQRTTERFIVGSAQVLVDNTTGWADLNTVNDPFVLSVRPGRAIRMGVAHQVHGVRWLFRGFVDAVIPTYDPTETDQVELVCVDALGEVNRAKLPDGGPEVGVGDTVDARIDRILDAAHWPATKRDLWPTGDALIAHNLGGQVADLVGQAADSGGGSVFGDLEGSIAYRNRDWQTFAPGTPPDGAIGNLYDIDHNRVTYADNNYLYFGDQVIFGAAAIVNDVCPTRWERPFARADITTLVIMGRDAETAVVLGDQEGWMRYGIEPFERTDLLTASDGRIETLAARILRTRSAAHAPRVRSVSLDAATSDEALDLMSTVDVYKPSRYRCRLQYPPPRDMVFDEEYFATGVAYDVTPSAWTLELNLDSAAPYEAAGGRWDSALWDQSLWVTPARSEQPA